MRLLLFFVLFVVALQGCVPNRKFVYLQKNDVNNKDIRTDTVLRQYTLHIDDYKIQPLDLLSVRIESLTDDEFDFFQKLYPVNQGSGQNPSLTGFLVDNKGEVEFPVVGRISLAGLSVFQAEEQLEKAFTNYLKSPVARVRLLNFRFTLLGEVNRESQVVSPNSRVTLMEAIGLAGGLTDLADRSSVKIIRQRGEQAEVFYVNLLQEELVGSANYYVQQNDIIVVPALRQRPFRKYGVQNVALLFSVVSIVLISVNLLQ
jgi:polysaccharide biosynthesis/export protein